MSAQEPHETDPGQGSLFAEVVTTRYPTTDPDDAIETIKYDLGEGEGVFPEIAEAPVPERTALEIATEAAEMAMERSSLGGGQRGAHSPLQRDGTYLAVKAGDFLPGFGKVTHSNFTRAYEVARSLENRRLHR